MFKDGRGPHGFEMIAVWQSQIDSGRTWYTDSNGIELVQREWVQGILDQMIPANYHPVTSMIGVKDDSTSMFVLNDRAQGGTSIKPGRVELMFNRKTTANDNGGVSDAGNGQAMTGEVDAEFYLHLGTQNEQLDLRQLFKTLLRKSAEIANPLQFFI